MAQDTPAPPVIMMPLPKDFDISRLPSVTPATPQIDIRATIPREDPNRLPRPDLCDRNNPPSVPHDRFGEMSREAMRNALQQCGQPSTVDMNTPIDGRTDIGLGRIGRVRVRHQF